MQHVDGILGRRAPVERRIEVRDEDVVGVDRLKAAGLEAAPVGGLEDERRRGVAHGAVGVRGAALELGRRARRGARPGAVVLVGGDDVGVIDPRDDRVAVEPVDGGERVAQHRGVLEHTGRRELRELQRAQRRLLVPRGIQPRRDDRPAARRGGAQRRLRGVGERHPEAVKRPAPADRCVARRVAAGGVLRGVLGQPDRDERPAQAVAVAPAQRRVRRMGGVRPRAAGIREVGDLDHLLRAVTRLTPVRRRPCRGSCSPSP